MSEFSAPLFGPPLYYERYPQQLLPEIAQVVVIHTQYRIANKHLTTLGGGSVWVDVGDEYWDALKNIFQTF